MTLLPTEARNYRPAEGPPYKVGPTCSVTDCNRMADHAHHVVRRSALGGAYDWVLMPDGDMMPNKVALCFQHHDDITVNRSRITYAEGKYYYDGALMMEWHAHENLDDHEKCPSCGRKMPRPKVVATPEEKKERATWAVSIPVDERENGYEVLENLLEGIREKLDDVGISYSESSKAKYYVLSTALALFYQHFEEVTSNG